MNRIKALYISIYLTLLVISSIFAGNQLISNGFNWQWLGALLATLPMCLFFIRLFVTSVARTSGHLNSILMLTVIGCVLAVWSAMQHGPNLPALTQSFVIGLVGFVLYVYWYSRFEDRTNKLLKIGKPLPDVELEDTQGNVFSSLQLLGQPTLLMFYRGNWCPLCMAQIKEIAGQYQALAKLGVQVVLISPQAHTNSQKLAEKFAVPFLFLVDRDNRAARQLNIDSIGGTPLGMHMLGYANDTVMPTVVITDADGKIIFADLTDNYRVRPEPVTFLKVLREYGV